MSGSVFKSNRGEFNKLNASIVDYLQASMAMDIEVIIKTGGKTPVDTGFLKKGVRHFKSNNGGYRVESEMEYSAYQERGEATDGSRKVVNYTTAGTGAGWFQDAIDKVISKKDNYILSARKVFKI